MRARPKTALSKYRRVTVQTETRRYSGTVPARGRRHNIGSWVHERDAAVAVDRAILHFGLVEPLNFPEESKRLGPLAPEELRREALHRARENLGGSRYFGVFWREAQKTWTVVVLIAGKYVELFVPGDEQTAAEIYDRLARGRGETHRLNFPDRRLPPTTLAEMRRELFVMRRARRSGSAFIGVRWSTKWSRWHVTIRVDGQQRHLGYWDDERTAARAHDRAALFLFGQSAMRNFPQARLIPASIGQLRAEARALTKAKATSRYRGVHWVPPRSKWQAVFEYQGRKHSLGHYDDEEEAALAIDRVSLHFFGPSAPRNFPRRRLEPATPAMMRDQQHAVFKERTTSRYVGVWWTERKQRWKATITVNHRVYHLGYYEHEIDAARSYDRAARRLRAGEGRLNFPAGGRAPSRGGKR